MKTGIFILTLIGVCFFSSMSSKTKKGTNDYWPQVIDTPAADTIPKNRAELNKTIDRIETTIENGKHVMKEIAKNAEKQNKVVVDTVIKYVPVAIVDCPDTIVYKPNFLQRIKRIFKPKK